MYRFEDKHAEIELALEKQRKKWQLAAIPSMDYDDVKQIIKIHIFKKWDKWEQDRPIEPWLARLISNQLKNLIRNNYGAYARPCLKCPLNNGGDTCARTKSGLQDSSCADYARWERKRKPAYDIKLAVTMENHSHEINSRCDDFLDVERIIPMIEEKIKPYLTDKQYRAFRVLVIEKYSEEEAAQILGFKTKEEKRSAGYKQIKNLEKIFMEKIRIIIEKEDIL